MSERDGVTRSLHADTRGVSTATTYALSLLVVTLLTSTLLAGGTTLVESEQRQAISTELDVVGERVASNLVAADRLARSVEGSGDVSLIATLPPTVGETRYELEVVDVGAAGDTYELVLRTSTPAVEERITVRTETDIAERVVRGGDLVVSYSTATGELEVSHV